MSAHHLFQPSRVAMSRAFVVALVVFAAAVEAATDTATVAADGPSASEGAPSLSKGPALCEVVGRTRHVTGRMAVIAPVPIHQVVEILVVRGARVKKGQALVRLDDDVQRAEVRGDEASLEHARADVAEARRFVASAEKSLQSGGFSEQRFFEARAEVAKAEANERLAQARLDASRAELEHYIIRAGIDGVVSALDVPLGMVSRPGTTVWGEILDLSEIDVDCNLKLEEVERIALGQEVEMLSSDRLRTVRKGTVKFIGLAADKETGLIPVVVRFNNENGRLRTGTPARLRFAPLEIPEPSGE